MRPIYQLILLLTVLFSFTSCEEPYTPVYEVEDSASILIIDGFINMGGNSQFKLSYTQPLGEEIPSPSVQGAQLTIEGENSVSYTTVNRLPSGEFAFNHPALPMDSRYRLRVRTAGKEYLSEWVTPHATSEISSIEYTRGDTGLDIFVSSVNTNENSNFYRWETEETWKFYARYPSSFIFDGGAVRWRKLPEENTSVCFQHEKSSKILINSTENQGANTVSRQQVQYIPHFSYKLMMRYSILVRQHNISRESYIFWSILKKNSESVGDIFGSMPSELKGNVQNISDPNEPVIAMIDASLPTEKRIYYNAYAFDEPWPVHIPYYSGCELFEIPLGEASHFFSGTNQYIPTHEIFNNPASAFPTHYAYTTRRCTDCSQIGSLNQPAFWTDQD